MISIGIDTSNYTTSAALFGDGVLRQQKAPLKVPEGGLGLRQSDAVFEHIKNLPGVIERLFGESEFKVDAVGVSVSPRERAGSYMPCFLAGYSHASVLASALGARLFTFSHQQGHVCAGALSSGSLLMLRSPFLAFHASGGTTELLLVRPHAEKVITCERIGGSTDLAAGQLVDRCGRLLGLPFPSGPALDSLALESHDADYFKVRQDGLEFSLSGIENKFRALFECGADARDIAFFTLKSIAEAVKRAAIASKIDYDGLPLLCVGGVMCSNVVRGVLGGMDGVLFAEPALSSDNAAGVAALACLCMPGGFDAR